MNTGARGHPLAALIWLLNFHLTAEHWSLQIFLPTMADEKKVELGMENESLDRKAGPYDGIANDPEMEGLTLYEKKALLVNRELDSQYIFSLCKAMFRGRTSREAAVCGRLIVV